MKCQKYHFFNIPAYPEGGDFVVAQAKHADAVHGNAKMVRTDMEIKRTS
ncbi:MAG: hypothetical protein GVY24_03550 [Planctomycetes bacterium]|nr:hypothetical protein [Planctomycetota bacterium]